MSEAVFSDSTSSHVDNTIEHAILGNRHGVFRHNGHNRTLVPMDAEPEFFSEVAEKLGEIDPERPNDKRIEAILEGLRLLVGICFPQCKRPRPAKVVLRAAARKFLVLAWRCWPELLPDRIRNETHLAASIGVTKSAVSQHLLKIGDALGIHFGQRREAARQRFRTETKARWAAGRMEHARHWKRLRAKAPARSLKRKPPARSKPSRR